MENLIIIGSGPAGYTAAIYAARAQLAPILFEGRESGGQIAITSEVENFPGFPQGILGSELMANFKKQAEKFGTKIINEAVTRVEFHNSPQPPLKVRGGAPNDPPLKIRGGEGGVMKPLFNVWCDDKLYESRSIIIATGASAKRLGLENEKKLYGKGVSACATCDAPFFKNKIVVVVGGGDAAMEEANFLAKFAQKVYVIHRRDEFRASKIMLDRARDNPKIEFIVNTSVEDVLGADVGRVTGVTLSSSPSPLGGGMPPPSGEGTRKWTLACDGLFAAIGHEPNTKIFAGQIELDHKGYIVLRPGSTMTSCDGVFAAGDCADYKYRQAITAAGSGCAAAIDAIKWLERQPL